MATLGWLIVGKGAGGDAALLPPLDELVGDATHIARIRVTDRRPVEFEFRGESRVCGYLYEATVSESLKGESGQLIFFGDGNEGFLDTDRSYFALIFERTDEEADALRRTVKPQLDDLGRENLECQLRASNLFARAKPQTLVPFEPEVVRPGEEWVQPGTLSAIPREELEAQFVDGMVRWADLRRALVKLMAS